MTALTVTTRMTRAMVVPRRLALLVGAVVHNGIRPTLVGASKAATSLSLIIAALMGLAPTTVRALPAGVVEEPAPVRVHADDVAKWLVRTMPISGLASAGKSDDAAPPEEGDKAWVEQMYTLIASNELEDAIDLLYDNVDEMLLAGKMSECDAILRTIDIHRLEGHLMVGVLSITLAAREHLPHRTVLVAEIEEHFRLTDPDNVEALMSGLR